MLTRFILNMIGFLYYFFLRYSLHHMNSPTHQVFNLEKKCLLVTWCHIHWAYNISFSLAFFISYTNCSSPCTWVFIYVSSPTMHSQIDSSQSNFTTPPLGSINLTRLKVKRWANFFSNLARKLDIERIQAKIYLDIIWVIKS